MEQEVIEKTHELLVHGGESKTFYVISNFFYFPEKRKKVSDYIKTCNTCQTLKDYDPRLGKLSGALEANESFSVVSTDLFSPFNLYPFKDVGQGNIITFIDFLTRTVALAFLRRIRGRDVVQAFKSAWLSKYPVLKILHSDRGPQYTSADLLEFCRKMGIRKSFSVAYNPTANSTSERINQTIKNGLRILKNQPMEIVVRKLEFSMNASRHRVIEVSPFEINNGYSIFDPLSRKIEIQTEDLVE